MVKFVLLVFFIIGSIEINAQSRILLNFKKEKFQFNNLFTELKRLTIINACEEDSNKYSIADYLIEDTAITSHIVKMFFTVKDFDKEPTIDVNGANKYTFFEEQKNNINFYQTGFNRYNDLDLIYIYVEDIRSKKKPNFKAEFFLLVAKSGNVKSILELSHCMAIRWESRHTDFEIRENKIYLANTSSGDETSVDYPKDGIESRQTFSMDENGYIKSIYKWNYMGKKYNKYFFFE